MNSFQDPFERQKKLVTIDGGHFDPYLGQFAAASTAAVSWFRQHLRQDQ